MMGRLEGKVAVVLGAAGKDNMAQVIGRRFVAEGAKIVAAGRNLDSLKEFAEPLGGIAVACDIGDKSAVEALADAALAKFGKVDIALNATGWGLMAPFLDTSEADLTKIVDLQFNGPFRFMQAMVRAMTANGASGGSIIQISSATATIMLDNHAAYMGTKAGIDHVVRCVANQFGAQGVRANSISPGFTDTPMTATAGATPGLKDAFVASYPLGRVGTSDDIAAAAVWLASDECFMTGENLQVNGGLVLRGNPSSAQVQASVMKAMAERGVVAQ
jgi:NAD(P)-dependent dehydrogenase (short-subunit alcohol dehydrogenase family)